MLKRIVFVLFFWFCSLCKPSLSASERAQQKMFLLYIRISEFFSIVNIYCPVPSKALSVQRCVFCGDSSSPRQVSFRFPFLRESDLPWLHTSRCPASAKELPSGAKVSVSTAYSLQSDTITFLQAPWCGWFFRSSWFFLLLVVAGCVCFPITNLPFIKNESREPHEPKDVQMHIDRHY